MLRLSRIGTGALVLLGLALAPAPAAGQVGTLHPVDEAASQPAFFTFRAQLQATLAARDTAALLAVVAPAIRNSFGDDDGRDAFREHWRLAEPDSPVWRELAMVLALGGRFENDSTFMAPYTYSHWDGQWDAFEHLVVIGSAVAVRERPEPAAPVLTRLSFAVVRRPPPSAEAGASADTTWTPIALRDGRTGYIASRYVRSPIDYRAIFMRRGAGWELVTFVAGD